MERMQLEYHEAAQEAGVYIVSACGFDSIPVDLGIIFAQQNFEGEINSVETYLRGEMKNGGLNYGTWESAVYGVAHESELRKLRSKLYPTKLPEFAPKLKSKYIYFYTIIHNYLSIHNNLSISIVYILNI